jgi:hypothetical protein
MNDKEHKKLAETIHDAVYSANQGWLSPNNGPPDLFGMVVGGGMLILMIYALLKMP